MRSHVVLELEQQRSDLGKPAETLFCVNTVAERENGEMLQVARASLVLLNSKL